MSSRLILGCGYLGQRVAAEWQKHGHAVHVLTRSPERAAAFRDRGFLPVIGDVTQPATLAALPEADVVLHAIGLDRASGKSQRDVYVAGLENVLACLAGRCGRFLYVSSTSVYGQNAGEWVDENSETAPASTNGQVCLDAEKVLRKTVPAATILRLAGIYGPSRLIARIDSLRSGTPVTGNPEAWLNLIHVDDAVQAVLASEARGTPGETCIVSDDRPIPRREYYTLLAQLAHAPPPQFAADPSDPALNKRCRNHKLHDTLHVTLRYPTIAEGLPAVLPSAPPLD